MSKLANSRRGKLRRGFTLYEVVLALAILLGSLAVLADLIATGSRAASSAQQRTEAVLLCKSKLAEIVASGGPLSSVAAAPCGDEAPGWVWSLSVSAGPLPELIALAVTVSHQGAGQAGQEAVTLQRWIRDPALFEMTTVEEEVVDPTTASGG